MIVEPTPDEIAALLTEFPQWGEFIAAANTVRSAFRGPPLYGAPPPPEVISILDRLGLVVARDHFYAQATSRRDIETSFEYDGGARYADPSVVDPVRLRQRLEALMPFAAEFDPASARGPKVTGFSWDLGPFQYSDPVAYYAILREKKPRRILEIGAGSSTMVACEAVRKNGFGEIWVIDPYPQDYLADQPEITRIIQQRCQDIDLAEYVDFLEDGSVLFIDSSHTIKLGGDTLFLYLQLLPAIRSMVTVHAHDIFLPNPWPRHWATDQIIWLEQYLLYGFLLFNRRTEMFFSSAWHEENNIDRLRAFMHDRFAPGGGSIWFQMSAC